MSVTGDEMSNPGLYVGPSPLGIPYLFPMEVDEVMPHNVERGDDGHCARLSSAVERGG